ncbi:hypothetical protein J437_LFUL017350, partial [Ladona fulva]
MSSIGNCFLVFTIVCLMVFGRVRTTDDYEEFTIFLQPSSHLLGKESYAYNVEETKKSFTVYWNVPSIMCQSHGIVFNLSDFGIRQNAGDEFRGKTSVILYDPGVFPALLKEERDRKVKMTERNGGVPQNGNLTMHLEKFKADVENVIPDAKFSGIAVIDIEYWRPVWRQNWDSLDIYRQLSRETEKIKHPSWTDGQIEKEAKSNFEKYARIFMEETLKLARELRPGGKWGYYAFPHCFNYDLMPSCNKTVMDENDQIHWLFEASSAIFPSVYLSDKNEGNKGFITGGVAEAMRVVANTSTPVYAYDDTFKSLEIPKSLEADGVMIWGSSDY